jgi:tRNA-Thr(GGU) m(6)t(6)A37 methyltransferase TsaA
MEICYEPIGTIHSPFTELRGIPIQAAGAKDIRGSIEVLPEFAEGLKDLDGFSHLILLYHFHLVSGPKLTVTPFLDSQARGLFSTRAPTRPNPIGISVVRLIKVTGSTLSIADVDMVDGTPLLDIKPYIPEMDVREAKRTGWFGSSGRSVRAARADDRFK